MLSKLELKGNDLLIYAIIYGFSQNVDCKFTGSLQYLADWTNSTKQGVLNSLKNLLDKKLITKKDYIINGVKFVEYYSNDFNEAVKKFEQGYSNNFNGGSQESLHNNINDKLIDNSINNIQKTNKKEIPTISILENVEPTVKESLTVEQTCKEYEQDFEEFYQAFQGVKTSKQPKMSSKVYPKWKNACKTHTNAEILHSVQKYAEYLQIATWRQKKDIIAWLNGAMYETDWEQEKLQEQQKTNQSTCNNQYAKPKISTTSQVAEMFKMQGEYIKNNKKTNNEEYECPF
jgi:hypothetical protein